MADIGSENQQQWGSSSKLRLTAPSHMDNPRPMIQRVPHVHPNIHKSPSPTLLSVEPPPNQTGVAGGSPRPARAVWSQYHDGDETLHITTRAWGPGTTTAWLVVAVACLTCPLNQQTLFHLRTGNGKRRECLAMQTKTRRPKEPTS